MTVEYNDCNMLQKDFNEWSVVTNVKQLMDFKHKEEVSSKEGKFYTSIIIISILIFE